MGILESKVTSDVVKFLKTLKSCWFWKVSDRFTSGIPDIVGCHCGWFFAIELKRPGKKPRALQRYIMRKIKQAGGRVLATDNLKDVEEFMSSFPC